MRNWTTPKTLSLRALLVAAFATSASAATLAQGAHAPDMLEACAPCHGADGIGRDAEIPNLAGQNEAYLYHQLRAFHDGSRLHKEMVYMSRQLSDDDMRALAAYYARLPPR